MSSGGWVRGGGDLTLPGGEKRVLTRVSWQLPADSDVPFAGDEAVDGANVVQPPAGHVIPGRSVGAGHHPGRPQRNGVNLEGEGH